MSMFIPALVVEVLKARRSKMPYLTALVGVFVTLVIGLFMMILRDPEWAHRNGLIADKAEMIAGTADWPTFFGLLTQAIAIGGIVVFGLIIIWLFSREFGDRTLKDLLALPTSREAIVGAKFVLMALWSMLFTALIYVCGLVIGGMIGLSGWSNALAFNAAVQLGVVALLTVMAVMPFAWVTSVGRGYLPAISSMFLVLFLSQFLTAAGWGKFCPWAVPVLIAGLGQLTGGGVGIASYLVVGCTGLIGLVATLGRWRFADHF